MVGSQAELAALQELLRREHSGAGGALRALAALPDALLPGAGVCDGPWRAAVPAGLDLRKLGRLGPWFGAASTGGLNGGTGCSDMDTDEDQGSEATDVAPEEEAWVF